MTSKYEKVINSLLKRIESFNLLDLGCSDGINEGWRFFGSKLRALGIDSDVAECERLSEVESLEGVKYVPGFLTGVDQKKEYPGFVKDNFYEETSASLAAGILANNQSGLSNRTLNLALDQKRALGIESAKSVSEIMDEFSFDSVDFVKIDLDGPDFSILLSMENVLKTDVIAVEVEVNMFGGTEPWENSFGNVDTYMKSLGFELCDLSLRRYGCKEFPLPFEWGCPAQTTGGRLFQGDALYVRALHENSIGEDYLVKKAIIYLLFDLVDCAVSIISKSSELSDELDRLTRIYYESVNSFSEYLELIRVFSDDPTRFFRENVNKL